MVAMGPTVIERRKTSLVVFLLIEKALEKGRTA